MSLNVFLQTETARRRLSQADLHRETGITKALLSAYFAGTKKPHGKNLGRLALALGVSVEEILAADGRAPSQTKLIAEVEADVAMRRLENAIAELVIIRTEKVGKKEIAKAALGVVIAIFDSIPYSIHAYRNLKARGTKLGEFIEHVRDHSYANVQRVVDAALDRRRESLAKKKPSES